MAGSFIHCTNVLQSKASYFVCFFPLYSQAHHVVTCQCTNATKIDQRKMLCPFLGFLQTFHGPDWSLFHKGHRAQGVKSQKENKHEAQHQGGQTNMKSN